MFGHRNRQEPFQTMAGIAITWKDFPGQITIFYLKFPQFGQLP